MKYFCAILAFLVLTLSVQPVCAGISNSENCCSENTCNENGAPDEKSQKEKGCSGSCNPFQICGCCAFGVVPGLSTVFTFIDRADFIRQSWAFFTCPFIEEPVLGFWQPPKLS